jgi:hypothetical protein
MGIGVVKIASGFANANRGARQMSEQLSDLDPPSERNLLDLAPFGQEYDDCGEPTPGEYSSEQYRNLARDPFEHAVRVIKDYFAIE